MAVMDTYPSEMPNCSAVIFTGASSAAMVCAALLLQFCGMVRPNLCAVTHPPKIREGASHHSVARPGFSSQPTHHAVAHEPRLQAICGCKWTGRAVSKRVCAINGFLTAGD